MQHSFTAILERTESKLWNWVIRVPDQIGDAIKATGNTRLIATFNNTEKAFCSFKPGGKVGYWLTINKEIRTKLKLDKGSKIKVKVEPDNSKYGMPLPEEMEELMYQDPEGEAIFHKLTPGKQRSLLYLIGKPKTSDTRLRKALAILEYLKMVNGKLDFPEMNEFIKGFKI